MILLAELSSAVLYKRCLFISDGGAVVLLLTVIHRVVNSALNLFPLLPSLLDLVPTPHDEKCALETPSHDIDTPGAPATWPESRCETRCPNKTAGRLNAHHRDAQATHPLEHICCIDLRKVLYRCEHGGENAQEVCPRLEK